MEQKQNESRASYLIRVVHAFMNETMAGSEHMFYDEADCDGLCLADDVDAVIIDLLSDRDELLAALKVAEKMLVEQECELRSMECDEPNVEPAILQARDAIAEAEGLQE